MRTVAGRLTTIVSCAVMLCIGCGTRTPFRYASVSGSVRYEDGSVLPVPNLVVNFHSLARPVRGSDYSRVGSAIVDPKTGRLAAVGSVKGQVGIVQGKHKVTLHLPNRQPLRDDVASASYSDPLGTPLEVDTRSQPFDIRIAKPK